MRTFVRWWLNFDGWRTYCACLISACWMMHKRFGVFVLCSASLYKIWKICGIANVLRPHTDRHIRIYLHCRIAIVAQRPQVFFVVVARNWFWSTICPVILFFRIFFSISDDVPCYQLLKPRAHSAGVGNRCRYGENTCSQQNFWLFELSQLYQTSLRK